MDAGVSEGITGPWAELLLLFLVSTFASPLRAQDVLTYRNDNARTGQDLNETILTTSNVNSN